MSENETLSISRLRNSIKDIRANIFTLSSDEAGGVLTSFDLSGLKLLGRSPVAIVQIYSKSGYTYHDYTGATREFAVILLNTLSKQWVRRRLSVFAMNEATRKEEITIIDVPMDYPGEEERFSTLVAGLPPDGIDILVICGRSENGSVLAGGIATQVYPIRKDTELTK